MKSLIQLACPNKLYFPMIVALGLTSSALGNISSDQPSFANSAKSLEQPLDAKFRELMLSKTVNPDEMEPGNEDAHILTSMNDGNFTFLTDNQLPDSRSNLPNAIAISSPETVRLGNPIGNINRFAADFDLVIVINTAVRGARQLRQVGYFFEKRRTGDLARRPFELTQRLYVSSGTRAYRTVELYDANKQLLKDSNGNVKTKTYYRATEAGYFPVNFTERSHQSVTLRLHDPLEYFVGFNPKDGQGLHLEKLAEHQALSNGCIRLGPDGAPFIFNHVNETYVKNSTPASQLRYMDKLTGRITTLALPSNYASLPSRTERQEVIRQLESQTFGIRIGDFNRVTNFRTLVIVNDDPDRDFSNLANPTVEAVPPNAG
jgi:hypothetical protein